MPSPSSPLAFLALGQATPGPTLHWIDIVGLALVGLFGLLGAFRGLWWQVIRLLGLAAAVAVARALAPRFGPEFQRASELPPPVAHGLVWLVIFLGVLVVASVLGALGKRTLEAVRLGPVDRFGGLMAGILTAVLLHAAFLVGLSYLGREVWAAESLQQAESRRLLQTVTTRLQLYVGEEDAARLRGWFEPDGQPAPDAHDAQDGHGGHGTPAEPGSDAGSGSPPGPEPPQAPRPTPSGEFVR